MPRLKLTRRAFLDLEAIYTHSCHHWGEAAARKYVADLYRTFDRIAADPRVGCLRRPRSDPFLMVRCNRHFILYENVANDIIIITLFHTRQDIESLVRVLEDDLRHEGLAARESDEPSDPCRPPTDRTN